MRQVGRVMLFAPLPHLPHLGGAVCGGAQTGLRGGERKVRQLHSSTGVPTSTNDRLFRLASSPSTTTSAPFAIHCLSMALIFAR